MNKLTIAVATAALAFSGMAGIASAQQYPYPNPGYPSQSYPQHRRHHRQYGGYNGQQCNANGYGGYYNSGGYYNNDGYNANGNCATLQGTIIGVNGNQVTLRLNGNAYGGYNNGGYDNRRRGDDDGDRDDNNAGYYNSGRYNGSYQQGRYGRQITIDDQPALNNQTSGRVAVGRYVTAYGYWQNGVFYATTMN